MWRHTPQTTPPPFRHSENKDGNFTGVTPRGTRVVLSYLLRVQGWYRRSSRGASVPPEGTSVALPCLLDSARCALSIPSETPTHTLPPRTRDCDHTQQLILNTQLTSIQGEHLVWVRAPPPERDRTKLPKRKRTKHFEKKKLVQAGEHPPKPPCWKPPFREPPKYTFGADVHNFGADVHDPKGSQRRKFALILWAPPLPSCSDKHLSSGAKLEHLSGFAICILGI